MSPGTPPQGRALKKDSIFLSVAPVQELLPVPAAPAPRAFADPDAILVLKQKIDDLEKNIVAQFEQKLGDYLRNAAPPPPPPPGAPKEEAGLLCGKIEDLGRKLSELGSAASLFSSQLKNIEESTGSAGRETEALLKALLGLQKHSETMQQRLDEAGPRADDLEKKLAEFHSSLLALETRRREEAAASCDKSAAAVEALAARLAGVEGKISAIPGQPVAALEALSDRLAGIEGKISAIPGQSVTALETLLGRLACVEGRISAIPGQSAAALDALSERLTGIERRISFLAAQPEAAARQEAVSLDLLSSLKSYSASLTKILDADIRRELELLRDKFSAETAAQLRGTAASAEESRVLIREQVQVSAARQAQALEDFASRLEAGLRAANQDFAAAVKNENDERFDKFSAKYADALLSVTYIENFRAAIGSAIDKLQDYELPFKNLLKEVPPQAQEKVMGVSGDLLRKKIRALSSTIEGLKSDGDRLREIKRQVEERFRGVFGNRL